jgi:hypothetical protein
MAHLPGTVAVACPRCGDDITCTLEAVPVPSDDPKRTSAVFEVRVPDLGDRFAAHYEDRH